MQSGDEVKVRLIKKIDEKSASVEIIDSGKSAMLKIKGKLRVLKDGTIKAWVIQHNRKGSKILLGNSYFGKYDISPGIKAKYVDILEKMFKEPLSVTDANISELKGMVNRCLLHDQWDWYTTYTYLGYPTYSVMNCFVKESVVVRNSIRESNWGPLFAFRDKYAFLLQSIALHLNCLDTDDEFYEQIAIGKFEKNLWDRLSSDSKKNIIIAEKIATNASKYILMHYFVTIEQEFYLHYIEPFIRELGHSITTKCNNRYVNKSHEILTGNTHFSLGAIAHLGRSINTERDLNCSDALKKFNLYLGKRKEAFSVICELIGYHLICGMKIADMRNGLVHGNEEVIAKINNDAYEQIHEFLFEKPNDIMKKLLYNSMKYEKDK